MKEEYELAQWRLVEWKRKNRTQYDSIITYFTESNKYDRENLRITQTDTEFVTTQSLSKGISGPIIIFTVPANYKIATYRGSNEVLYPDIQTVMLAEAYGFKIKATDSSGREVDGSTKVEIFNFDPAQKYFSSCLESPYYVRYDKVNGKNGLFKFPKHHAQEKPKQQVWKLIEPDVDVEIIEYCGLWDLWSQGRIFKKTGG